MPATRKLLPAVEREGLMVKGREAFLRGDWYEAHEIWEEAWNGMEEPERLWVQGMIQVATGLYKLERQRPDLCVRLLRKALSKLEGAPEFFDGVGLATARAGVTAAIIRLERGEGVGARPIIV